MKATADRLGNATTVEFDALGRRVREVDPRNHPTTFDYDPVGRLESMTDALGGVVAFGYDEVGNRVSITDPNTQTRTFAYNLAGDLIGETDAVGETTSHSYDLAGRRVATVDPLGRTTSFGFDDAGRLVSEDRPDGAISYGYDPAGRRNEMVDPTGATSWVHDRNGQVTEMVSAAGTIGYSWDPAGRLAQMVTPDGPVTYTYDPAGRLATLTDHLDRVTAFGWTPGGRQASVVRPNGVDTAYSYDLAGRLVGIDHVGPDGPVAGFDYTLDPAGNRTGVDTLAGSESYVLDELNRLVSASYVDGSSEEFTYDPAGNRLTRTGPEGTTAYTYGPTGALEVLDGPDGPVSFSYDELGQLIATSGGDSYSYDTAGRITAATVEGVSQSFGYDADGVRVEVDGQAQLWDRAGGLPNLIGDDTAYVHGPGGLLTTGDDWALTDALGSVRGVTDSAGALTASIDYRAFGQPTSSWDSFGFTGGIHDRTGQIHLRARNLDPALGRFITRDPIQPGAPGTGGYNHYTYVANNPTTWTDPSGQMAESALLKRNATHAAPAAGQAGWAARAKLLRIAGGLAGVCTFGQMVGIWDCLAVPGGGGADSGDGPDDEFGPRVPDRRRQDRQFRDAVHECERRIGRRLTRAEQRELHDWITKQGFDYHEIVDECIYLFEHRR